MRQGDDKPERADWKGCWRVDSGYFDEPTCGCIRKSAHLLQQGVQGHTVTHIHLPNPKTSRSPPGVQQGCLAAKQVLQWFSTTQVLGIHLQSFLHSSTHRLKNIMNALHVNHERDGAVRMCLLMNYAFCPTWELIFTISCWNPLGRTNIVFIRQAAKPFICIVGHEEKVLEQLLGRVGLQTALCLSAITSGDGCWALAVGPQHQPLGKPAHKGCLGDTCNSSPMGWDLCPCTPSCWDSPSAPSAPTDFHLLLLSLCDCFENTALFFLCFKKLLEKLL